MILLDTHVLVWLLSGDQRLGAKARESIEHAAVRNGVRISAITPWEIALLARKGRLVLGQDPRAWMASALSIAGLSCVVIDADIAVEAALLPEQVHADPADRFLIATARRNGWPLVTADQAILGYASDDRLQVIDASS